MQEIRSNQQEQPISSFMERAVDIFAAPSKVFEEVARVPVQKSSWVLPYLLMLVLALLTTFVILSDQTLRDQALEPQRQAMQERVDKGEMTQEQMDQATEMMESSTMIIISGSVMSVIYVTISIFGAPLIFWLAIKMFFKSNAPYKKLLEAYGLSTIIGLLNVIVTLLMMQVFASILATPGASLLIMGNFDRNSLAHSIIAAINFISIWQMVVFGIGLSRLSNKSTGAGIGVSLGFWFLWIIVISLVGSMMR
ncbi:MAG: YIP1 family protein [Ignavibacteriales bacterium]|nr:YIP1 family protein [Ignavibacteriales bacterium]